MLPATCRHKQAGFTLIEMIIAIVVIGVLAAAAVLLLRGPIALQLQQQRQIGLLDQAGLLGMRLKRELAMAQGNSVTLAPSGTGFVLAYTTRPPTPQLMRYRCLPNAANPAFGILRREPGGVLIRNVQACRAMNPQAPAYLGNGGRSQLVEMAVRLADGEQRVDVFYALRVGP